jgi:hypothetical protein
VKEYLRLMHNLALLDARKQTPADMQRFVTATVTQWTHRYAQSPPLCRTHARLEDETSLLVYR